MGIFGQLSSFDSDIEKATNETNTTEDWALIMEICDKITNNSRNAKEYLKSILKRLAHNDPHVVIHAITLLDACVKNCGKPFHLEVASRDFETEYRKLLTKVQPQVASKMRQQLKRWADTDFKTDPELNLIPTLYAKLKSEGHDFSESTQKGPKSSSDAVKDPVGSSQREQDDLAKAIELSLKESSKASPNKLSGSSTTSSAAYPSLYPSFSTTQASSNSDKEPTAQAEPRKVRALYDFEAAEANELTFIAGEIIHVLDDTDPNWWKGYNQRGDGLFPSNFVTADLSVEPERLEINQKTKNSVQSEEENNKGESSKADNSGSDQQLNKNYVPEVNEEKIDRLLHLLHEANPEDPSQDSEEMLRLEQEVHQMAPLIDSELERVDQKHAQLTMLSSNLVEAINLYHTLMRDDHNKGMNAGLGYGNMPGSMPYAMNAGYNHPPQQNFQMYPGHSGMQQQQIPNMYNQVPGMQQFMPQALPTSAPNVVQIPFQNGHIQQNNPLPMMQNYQPQAQMYSSPVANSMQHQQPPPHYPQMMPQQGMQQQQPQQPPIQNGVQQITRMFPQMMQPPPQQPQNLGPQPNSFPPQMVAPSINQPVTQTFLGQNDAKNNIPIYQQQR